MSHALTHPASPAQGAGAPYWLLTIGLTLSVIVVLLAAARLQGGSAAAATDPVNGAGVSRPALASVADTSVPDASTALAGREFVFEEPAPTF